MVRRARRRRHGEQILDGGVRLRRRRGMLLTPERKAFAHKWIWLAGLIAFVIFLPNLIWNIQHHFPFLELMRNIRASGRDMVFTSAGYLKSQIFLITPLTFPVWLLGALYFFFWRDAKPFRVLGWTFVTMLTVFVVLIQHLHVRIFVQMFVLAQCC
jgi:hypothetical protein